MDRDVRKENLLKAIRASFQDVLRPSNDKLLDTGCHDDMDIQWLYPYTEAWSDLPGENIGIETATLGALSAEAFVWALPAYLTWILENLEECKSTTVEDTISKLCPHGEFVDFLKGKYANFTEEQKKAIRDYLRFFRDFEPELLCSDQFQSGLDSWQVKAV